MADRVSKTPRPIRPHPTDPAAALVELTRGYWAVIDAADAAEVGRFCWSVRLVGRTNYAMRAYRVDGVLRSISLHRFIGGLMGISFAPEIDHRDGNGLDCRRRNLRPASHAQNMMNIGARANSSTGALGVSRGRRGKWRATVQAHGRMVLNREFDTFEDAAAAANAKRHEFHGEFVRN